MTAGYGPKWDDMTLDEWLSALGDGSDEPVVDFASPNKRLRAEYLDSTPERTDDEVRDLLRHFLMKTGELGSDETRVEWLKRLFLDKESTAFGDAMHVEYYRRLIGADPLGEPAWQGLSWVLDLLPRRPMKAINVLEAYLLAHVWHMPDGRIAGIGDAQAVIRAMWIGNPTSGAMKRKLLYGLGSERFEHLVEALYDAMRFATTMTARTRDGGRDVEIVRDTPGGMEKALVECKLWTGRVGVKAVRDLRGVVARETTSLRGILVSASSFTQPARQFAEAVPQLELIGWDELLCLLDEHLGADWGSAVDSIITGSMKRRWGDEPT